MILPQGRTCYGVNLGLESHTQLEPAVQVTFSTWTAGPGASSGLGLMHPAALTVGRNFEARFPLRLGGPRGSSGPRRWASVDKPGRVRLPLAVGLLV